MSTKVRKSSYRQKGAAAVEFALMLPLLVLMLMAPLFLAVCFWHYTAAHKAAQNGARYLSTISEAEMRVPALAAAAKLHAEAIVRSDLAELFPKGNAIAVVTYCGEAGSGARNLCTGVGNGPLPESVDISVQFWLKDGLFKFFNTGRYGWSISVVATVPYASA